MKDNIKYFLRVSNAQKTNKKRPLYNDSWVSMLGKLFSMFPPSISHLSSDEILITSQTGTLSYETCVAQTIYDFMNLKTLKSLKS